jgi:NADPH:quinone reductase-like Zn-dependent oxidoreductase
MKAVRIHEFGGPEVLRFEEAPDPRPRAGEVLITLKAAALNHLDIWVRSGARERNIPLPHIPGSDGAGVVAETGEGVEHLKPGDRVLISPGLSCGHCEMCLGGRDNLCASYRVLGVRDSGTYAERVAVPIRNVIPLPQQMDFVQGAATPLVFLTAWHMLITLAKIRPGETVLIHGAGSGVGSAAIQIARMIGLHVIATAGSGEKIALALSLGAQEAINYAEKDFVEEVRRLTDKRGVDVVFEHVGGEVFQKSITVLARGGRLVTCGATTDYMANVDIRYIYSRHQAIFGSWMGSKNELIEVLKFFGTDSSWRLKPIVDTVFPLDRAADAHRHLEGRKNFGKVVLEIG